MKHKDQIAQLIQRGYDKDPVKVWQTDYDRMLNTNPEDVEVEDDQVRLEQGTNQGPSPGLTRQSVEAEYKCSTLRRWKRSTRRPGGRSGEERGF